MTSRFAIICAGFYLILAAISIAYELSIRVFDTGNSEFAGMLSFALTLPSSLAIDVISKAGLGINVGDSNMAFVAILGLAALVNAGLLYVILSRLRRRPPM
jgi:hypothetical protein